ncbi:MAG: phosphate acyltransferase PlsX [Actinobacteria bacterium]|nr:MAG: phosphate acyltransferase PlsX [Actinomycetota bacterium]RIK08445.1 MAG: phosphate acyltransferase PlsX [Acidobacteriota bacterium]
MDAMGGDHAPGEIVRGAILAEESYGIAVTLVGDPERLAGMSNLEIVPSSQVIAMDDDPGVSVRRMKDASMVRAAELVRDGKARAMVGAGNTGATMASALLRMGRIKGLKRPAIAAAIPDLVTDHFTVMLDVGANAECPPSLLLQFARMGAAFARERFGCTRPRVGLLSIGEEASKGDSVVKEAHELLDQRGWQDAVGAEFLGNAEGRDLMGAQFDVIVTDGFTGNVALKGLEGGMSAVTARLGKVFSDTAAGRKAGAALGDQLQALYDQINPDLTGGAMLLGVRGVCMIAHGSSNAVAIASTIRLAAEMADHDIVARLRAAIAD